MTAGCAQCGAAAVRTVTGAAGPVTVCAGCGAVRFASDPDAFLGVGERAGVMQAIMALMAAADRRDWEGCRLVLAQERQRGNLPVLVRCQVGLIRALCGLLQTDVPVPEALLLPASAPHAQREAARAALRLMQDPGLASIYKPASLGPAVMVLTETGLTLWAALFGDDTAASLAAPLTAGTLTGALAAWRDRHGRG